MHMVKNRIEDSINPSGAFDNKDSFMAQKRKLLDRMRDTIRLKNYSYRTEKAYVRWVKRYIFYHQKRHPEEMGKVEVEAFLTHLAVEGHVAASTQNQALSALLFLYGQVLRQPLGQVDVTWAKKPVRSPIVLTREEVSMIMRHLSGIPLMVVQLLYGGGLRLTEGLRLRVQDVDFGQKMIVVRDGKGQKDRATTLPDAVVPALQSHIQTVKAQHHHELQRGHGRAPLPNALAKKYPNAETEWPWQFVFPAKTVSKNPRGDNEQLYRYHLHESTVQKAVRKAAQQSGIAKRVTPHTFRHSFATHLLETGYDIRTIQELLGHKDVQTTMIYTHVAQRGAMGVRSPLDTLEESR